MSSQNLNSCNAEFNVLMQMFDGNYVDIVSKNVAKLFAKTLRKLHYSAIHLKGIDETKNLKSRRITQLTQCPSTTCP